MKTHAFEQKLMDSIGKTSHSSWLAVLQQKHPYIRLLKKKANAQYAGRIYKIVATLEVPTTDGYILMTMCSTKDEIHFYYFGITKDETSVDDLNEMYEKYSVMKQLGFKM